MCCLGRNLLCLLQGQSTLLLLKHTWHRAHGHYYLNAWRTMTVCGGACPTRQQQDSRHRARTANTHTARTRMLYRHTSAAARPAISSNTYYWLRTFTTHRTAACTYRCGGLDSRDGPGSALLLVFLSPDLWRRAYGVAVDISMWLDNGIRLQHGVAGAGARHRGGTPLPGRCGRQAFNKLRVRGRDMWPSTCRAMT